MIDNKNLSDLHIKTLSKIPYQEKVRMWEKNCSECPFKILKVGHKGEMKDIESLVKSYDLLLFHENYEVERGCNFADQNLSLNEVIMNTCRFWKSTTCEGGQGVDIPDNNPIILQGDKTNAGKSLSIRT